MFVRNFSDKYESITIEDSAFDLFFEACEKARAPNKALLNALAFTEEKGIKWVGQKSF